MRSVKNVAIAVAVVMALTIIYGFVSGEFGDEGSMILDIAWGRVTLIDLYAGIALIGAWVLYREGLTPESAGWLTLFVITGNLGTAVYVAVTAHRAGDDHLWFWMGKRARLEVSRRS